MIRARLAPTSVPERIVVDVRTDHEGDAQLWWETVAGDPPPVPDRLDVAALALVAKAMNYGQDLHLDGPVSWRLLANLEEFVDAWTQWRPATFRPVSLSAEEVIDDRGRGPGELADRAVAAFSGGLDGTYGVHLHARGLLGRRTLRVAAAVLVGGFDIPLDDDLGLAAATTGAPAAAPTRTPLNDNIDCSPGHSWGGPSAPSEPSSVGPAPSTRTRRSPGRSSCETPPHAGRTCRTSWAPPSYSMRTRWCRVPSRTIASSSSRATACSSSSRTTRMVSTC